MRTLGKTFMTLACLAVFATNSWAADVNIRVLGWYGNQPQSQVLERPFWENIEKSTQGQFKANFRTIDELGLKGFESLRTLQSGAFDIVSFQITFVGGEAPVLMGADLPGAAFNFDDLQRNLDAYRPVMERDLDSRFNAKLLTAWSFPFQILYCKGQVKSLDELRGKKVRVSGALSAKLIESLGGASVTLAGPEVYQAMMQGVVDCAVTGSQYGNSNDWFEVSDSLLTTPVGGAGVVLHVARKAFWEKLTPEQQATLSGALKKLEDDLWAMGREGHDDGINCNIGRTPCDGKPGKMTLVESTPADREKVNGVLKDVLIPLWLEDCTAASGTCGDDWFKTAGAAAGIQQ